MIKYIKYKHIYNSFCKHKKIKDKKLVKILKRKVISNKKNNLFQSQPLTLIKNIRSICKRNKNKKIKKNQKNFNNKNLIYQKSVINLLILLIIKIRCKIFLNLPEIALFPLEINNIKFNNFKLKFIILEVLVLIMLNIIILRKESVNVSIIVSKE